MSIQIHATLGQFRLQTLRFKPRAPMNTLTIRLFVNFFLLPVRHESSEKENTQEADGMQVRVQNTKLGISTFWSLEKFQNNMAAMRELEQVDGKTNTTSRHWY